MIPYTSSIDRRRTDWLELVKVATMSGMSLAHATKYADDALAAADERFSAAIKDELERELAEQARMQEDLGIAPPRQRRPLAMLKPIPRWPSARSYSTESADDDKLRCTILDGEDHYCAQRATIKVIATERAGNGEDVKLLHGLRCAAHAGLVP